MANDESDWMPLDRVIAHVEATQHCYRERAIALVREAIGGLRSKTVSGALSWVESHLPDGSEIFFSNYDRGIEVRREDVLLMWPERSRPPPGQPTSNVPLGHRQPRENGVVQAIRDLWPNGIPEGLKAKERNNRIITQLKENGASVPRDVPKAVQRALRAHPELYSPARNLEAVQRRE
jgi:hypothetical protein